MASGHNNCCWCVDGISQSEAVDVSLPVQVKMEDTDGGEVWSTEREDKFVELWSERPCLFDIQSRDYSNKHRRDQAKEEMAFALECTVLEITKHMNSLRTQYTRHLISKPKSGSGQKKITPRQQWLLRHLDFLKCNVRKRPSTSNLEESLGELEDTTAGDVQSENVDIHNNDVDAATTSVHNGESATLQMNSVDQEGCSAADGTNGTEHTSVQPSMHSRLPPKKPGTVRKCSSRKVRQAVEERELELLEKMVNIACTSTDTVAKIDDTPTQVEDDDNLFSKWLTTELRLIKDETSKGILKFNISNLVFQARYGISAHPATITAAPGSLTPLDNISPVATNIYEPISHYVNI